MSKQRLEAFTDGVIAVIITIMVLDMKVPPNANLGALRSVLPVFLAYALSFTNVGIFWNNHHHMLHATERISGLVLWTNLSLLFWLSLVPFVTGWMGENHFETLPVALYGVVLFMCGIAYYILSRLLIAHDGRESNLAIALGRDRKGIVSLLLYIVAIPLAFFSAPAAFAVYVLVAAIWFIPDRRIESMLRP